mmetsp:Transcript_20177/g.30706  ORF Transcript_20177/g.30706 Transcript_20177/m.30706 type:complete len:85 (+) Transcript_20177:957-1211(+)
MGKCEDVLVLMGEIMDEDSVMKEMIEKGNKLEIANMYLSNISWEKYMSQAIELYEKWGATAKVEQLVNRLTRQKKVGIKRHHAP